MRSRFTYEHSKGDGPYCILEKGTGSDSFVFSDVNIDDVTFIQSSGGDLVMNTGTETITVIDQFDIGSRAIEEIIFTDGTTLDLAGITDKIYEHEMTL
ncbi:calcium-binding protein [Pseudotabrizicola sediminis]|nr:calcium-binding protein [Pseudotabrizicola sediminis]